MSRLPRIATLILAITVGVVMIAPAHAHFPWLAVDDQGHALMFFGESPSDREYHVPECVAEATLFQLAAEGKTTKVEHKGLESDDYIGRKSAEKVDAKLPLVSQCKYGIYHGTLLSYYSRFQPLDSPAGDKASDNTLDARLKKTDKGIDLIATWDGKPLAGATVTLIDGAGEQAEDTTNNDGKASFTSLGEGVVGFIVGNTLEQAGEFEGDKYESESHYLTVSTNYTKAAVPAQKRTTSFPPLPEPIASFGAVECDGYLYVYSGHTGRAHAHSRDNLSQHFVRLKLEGGSESDTAWQELKLKAPLQGLPIVAYDGKVYRIGGLDARNAEGEEDDLHSVDTFAEYDPATNDWRELAPLPAPRSSHNAVVIGDKLYVVGGWTLSGKAGGDWQKDALVYDFANADAGWQKLPEPPFLRRALAIGTTDGKLVVMGGLDDIAAISLDTFIFDPATEKWTQGPAIPGKEMDGFGLSAWPIDGQLYTGGLGGTVYRLASDMSSWQPAGELATPRFFHQFSADGKGNLIVIAGATADDGHVATLDVIEVESEE